MSISARVLRFGMQRNKAGPEQQQDSNPSHDHAAKAAGKNLVLLEKH